MKEFIAPKQPLKWWFIYGSGRLWRSYLDRCVARCAVRKISDWGLGLLLAPLEQVGCKFDKDRYRRDVRANILANARQIPLIPGGQRLDFAFKQAGTARAEYQ